MEDQQTSTTSMENAINLLLEAMDMNIKSIAAASQALESHKSGLHSRQEKLGTIIGESPERLRPPSIIFLPFAMKRLLLLNRLS